MGRQDKMMIMMMMMMMMMMVMMMMMMVVVVMMMMMVVVVVVGRGEQMPLMPFILGEQGGNRALFKMQKLAFKAFK